MLIITIKLINTSIMCSFDIICLNILLLVFWSTHINAHIIIVIHCVWRIMYSVYYWQNIWWHLLINNITKPEAILLQSLHRASIHRQRQHNVLTGKWPPFCYIHTRVQLYRNQHQISFDVLIFLIDKMILISRWEWEQIEREQQ